MRSFSRVTALIMRDRASKTLSINSTAFFRPGRTLNFENRLIFGGETFFFKFIVHFFVGQVGETSIEETLDGGGMGDRGHKTHMFKGQVGHKTKIAKGHLTWIFSASEGQGTQN